jgi:hypothetical protein
MFLLLPALIMRFSGPEWDAKFAAKIEQKPRLMGEG